MRNTVFLAGNGLYVTILLTAGCCRCIDVVNLCVLYFVLLFLGHYLYILCCPEFLVVVTFGESLLLHGLTRHQVFLQVSRSLEDLFDSCWSKAILLQWRGHPEPLPVFHKHFQTRPLPISFSKVFQQKMSRQSSCSRERAKKVFSSLKCWTLILET